MRSSRLVTHGATAATRGSSWLSTSADLVAPATAVAAIEGGSDATRPFHWRSGSVVPSVRPADSFYQAQSNAEKAHGHLVSIASPLVSSTTYTHIALLRDEQNTLAHRNLLALLQRSVCLFPFSGGLRTFNASVSTFPATRAIHTTTRCFEVSADALAHYAPPTASNAPESEAESSPAYDQERHIENAESLLRESYGPHAKIVLHRLTQRRRRAGPCNASEAGDAQEADLTTVVESSKSAADENTASSPSNANESAADGYYYRASATFRFLGFPVELAVANGRHPQETIESCLQQALASDIVFIRPSASHANHQNSSNITNGYSSEDNGGGGGGGANRKGGPRAHSTDDGLASKEGRQQNQWKGGHRHRHQSQNRNGTRHNSKYNNGFASVSTLNGGHAMRASRLTPHQLELKAIVDDLRQLCAHFSRSVKFSIKPPSASRGRHHTTATTATGSNDAASGEAAKSDDGMEDRQWRCRCYVKEEWSTIAQARLVLNSAGSSPNDALVRCLTQLRQRYKEEVESPAVLEEGVREVAGLVQLQRKTVTASCVAEPSSPSSAVSAAGLMEMPTYRAFVDVVDTRGNTASYKSWRQASPYAAYEAAAALALREEMLWDGASHLLSEGLPTPPLLWRLRWQFDLLVDHICRETGQAPAEVAWVQLTGEEVVMQTQPGRRGDAAVAQDSCTVNAAAADSPDLAASNVVSGVVVPPVPQRFTGSLFSERSVLVWQTSGGGRYRVEFDTYVQALYYLLDQYADCLASLPCMGRGVGEGLLFPSTSVLDLHVHRHDAFPVLQHHRGNLNCYALLGTLTSQLLGCPYTTHYHYDTVTNEYVATLTVNDGRVTNQPLIQRRSKKKGEAWRFACLDAIRENFPRQYAAILDRHPEVDLSADDMARSAHLRALPREKRIPYFVNLSIMVMTFAEEDLGWRQPRIRLRNLANSLGLPQWTAELEAQVEGEEGRRVVAVSASFPQMQAARRSLIYRLGKQYFPNELAIYRKLGRCDIVDPETAEVTRVNKFYIPNAAVNASMVSHVLALLEARHPTSAPLRFTLEARVKGRAQSHSVEAEAEATVSDSVVDMRYVEGDTELLCAQEPALLLRPPRVAYTARVLGNRGDVLIAEFDSDSATTTADAQAVPVLVTALKSASYHLAGGDAETLWTEYETHPLPATSSSRLLAIALFNRFFGSNSTSEVAALVPGTGTSGAGVPSTVSRAAAAAASGDAATGVDSGDAVETTSTSCDDSITVITTNLGDYWFGTAVLPRHGMLPIARAVASSKRKCTSDALIAAARRSFPRVLQYAVKHDVASAAVAAALLTEPVVEQLPSSVCRDIFAQLARKKISTPLPPFQLLVKCTKEVYPNRERFIRVQQTHDDTHGFQYRLYLQRGRVVRPGDTQLVGYGVSNTSAAAALHHASVMALENLYETALYAAVTAQPNYRTPPSAFH
ncbi:hypothetical protein N2W54_005600 [Lotmaria passim]